ncbi:hypothetical protein [Qingshengfaniella alkalisoli]|uniref:Uncharacterized protein n=1 Tax=Qingshengfaniella alkalisoli TaxID=2599296 RepID=A0A5B8I9B8_9RHOB|nr:hypothetical protein [Qingshengfaniella alkalisoli]QDY70835.1 hypothetical protein FPZ52_14085 [Qingshengfaniella alkalisoli]
MRYRHGSVCDGAWGHEFDELGQDERLFPPVYVKPFIRHQKNDTSDAERSLRHPASNQAL